MSKVQPLTQEKRPACSLPMNDADLSLNNSNWQKGLQAMSEWIWSANLNPSASPNNLGRYFLHIPGVFEQQLYFSTSLIFDEPSFKNGVQISGFINRVHKELIISLIAHTRRAWYTMTHHAILGKLTADKHGLDAEIFANKIYYLTEYAKHPNYYSPIEVKLFDFALAFATNPKAYTDQQFEELKDELRAYNKQTYQQTDFTHLNREAANQAKSEALTKNISLTDSRFSEILNKYVSKVPANISDELNEQKVNAQLVELSFLCLQFVALADVFSGLNIPDESSLSDAMTQLLPSKIIEKINELNELGLEANTPSLIPPMIGDNHEKIAKESKLFKAILKGQVVVKPIQLKGTRIPLIPYEGKNEKGEFRPAFVGMPDKDKGLTVGGIQNGVYGWSFGGHFPGSLPYLIMHHPELSRYEAPYSLPLIFNENEWKNGVNTGGFVSRKIKELIIQKVYRLTRSRYGIEHHTMYLYNAFLDEFGIGTIKQNVLFTDTEKQEAREKALERAEAAILYMHDHLNAPKGTYTEVEEAILTWIETLVKSPHKAYEKEERVRKYLKEQNLLEINLGIRILDTSPSIGKDAAMQRLINCQIAEMMMMASHMDGLARIFIILKIEAESSVQVIEGTMTNSGSIKPKLNSQGEVSFTGFFNNRPAFIDVLTNIGVSDKVKTLNELFLNPELCEKIITELEENPNEKIEITDNYKSTNPEF